MNGIAGSIRVLDEIEVLPHFIAISQVPDTAWMEVAEWRDDHNLPELPLGALVRRRLELGQRSGRQQASCRRST